MRGDNEEEKGANIGEMRERGKRVMEDKKRKRLREEEKRNILDIYSESTQMI